MKDMYPSGGSSVSGMAITDEAAVRRRWLYSFLAYYGFVFVVLALSVVLSIEPISWSQMLIVLYPGLHYYFYRKTSIYWFLFFTSLASSLGIVHIVLIELLRVLGGRSFLGLLFWFIEAGLFGYFLYNCFQLLKVNIKNHNDIIYKLAVENLWVASLLVCSVLSYIQSVHSLHYGFKVGLAEGLGMLCGDVIRVFLAYYFAIKKKGTWALLVILVFFPWPSLRGEEVSSIFNKLSWFGFFGYFCISTYRLYRVNKAEREGVAKVDDDSVEQISI